MKRTFSGILVAGLFLLGASEVLAQTRCRVMDPTGTPLNVRAAPNGSVVGQLRNGRLVTVLESSQDRRRRSWVYVADFSSGQPIGWVFREFVACF